LHAIIPIMQGYSTFSTLVIKPVEKQDCSAGADSATIRSLTMLNYCCKTPTLKWVWIITLPY